MYQVKRGQTPSMLCCVSSEGGGEREGERGEAVQAEGGPPGPAHPGLPGPDRGPHPASGPVGAGQGQVGHNQNQDTPELLSVGPVVLLSVHLDGLLRDSGVQAGNRNHDALWDM